MEEHTFNPSTHVAKQADLCELKAGLVCVSSIYSHAWIKAHQGQAAPGNLPSLCASAIQGDRVHRPLSDKGTKTQTDKGH